MKTIQQYFNANFNKTDKIIKFPKISEPLEGDTLTIENYSELEILNVEELTQIKEIIIKDCPKLGSIKYNNQQQNPVIIQPNNNKCDWRCFAIAGLLLWNALIFYLMIRWVKRHKKDCKLCQPKN